MTYISDKAKAAILSKSVKSSPYPFRKGKSFDYLFEYAGSFAKVTVAPWRDLDDLIVSFDGGRALVHGRYREGTILIVDDEPDYRPQRRAAEVLNSQPYIADPDLVVPQLIPYSKMRA